MEVGGGQEPAALCFQVSGQEYWQLVLNFSNNQQMLPVLLRWRLCALTCTLQRKSNHCSWNESLLCLFYIRCFGECLDGCLIRLLPDELSYRVFFYRSYLSTFQAEDLEIDICSSFFFFYVVFHRLNGCTANTKSEPHRACTVNDMGRYGIKLTVINVNIGNIRIWIVLHQMTWWVKATETDHIHCKLTHMTTSQEWTNEKVQSYNILSVFILKGYLRWLQSWSVLKH